MDKEGRKPALESRGQSVSRRGIGVIRAELGMRWRVHLRAHALDHEIAAGADVDANPLLRRRAEQLTAPKRRREQAAKIEQVIDMAERRSVINSAELPIDRPEVIEARAILLQLQVRLAGADPVTPRGMAMVAWLLGNGESPVFAPVGMGSRKDRQPGALAARARETLDAL